MNNLKNRDEKHMKTNSISLNQKIFSHIRYWKRFFWEQIKFIQRFSNYFQIASKLLKNQFPIIIKIKNFDNLEIKSYNAAYFLSHVSNFKNVQFDIEKDLVIIPKKNKKNNELFIKFHGGINNGDLIHSYLKSDYKDLPVSEKIILDIGMNIGDSSIYFIMNGAKKVIGIEPFPKTFELASKNIVENKLQDKIELVLAGCSSKEGTIRIDSELEGSVDNTLDESKNGYEIPLITLEGIIEKFEIPKNSILKIDCEGCEDEIISTVSMDVIRHFSDIQIEYHNGYQKIKDQLEKYGFIVRVTEPISSNVLGHIFDTIIKKKSSNKKNWICRFCLCKKEMNLLSIIILNYNAGKLLMDCVSSIMNSNLKDFEIILVDNCSSDNSHIDCKKKFESIRLIENAENLGYCEGNNVGLREARGNFIIILNPDTTVTSDWALELFDAHKKHGEGLYQPKILSMSENKKLGTTGNIVNIFGFGFSRGRGELDKGQYNNFEQIGYASGTCLFMSSKTFEKIGFLDPFLFAYHDDLEYGWRAHELGIKSYYVPTSIIYHAESFNFKWKPFKFYLLERNRHYCLLYSLFKKNFLQNFT